VKLARARGVPGWGAIIIIPDQEIEITGGAVATTKSQMELTAAIEASNVEGTDARQLTIE
jgi:ribonuclease HI